LSKAYPISTAHAWPANAQHTMFNRGPLSLQFCHCYWLVVDIPSAPKRTLGSDVGGNRTRVANRDSVRVNDLLLAVTLTAFDF